MCKESIYAFVSVQYRYGPYLEVKISQNITSIVQGFSELMRRIHFFTSFFF